MNMHKLTKQQIFHSGHLWIKSTFCNISHSCQTCLSSTSVTFLIIWYNREVSISLILSSNSLLQEGIKSPFMGQKKSAISAPDWNQILELFLGFIWLFVTQDNNDKRTHVTRLFSQFFILYLLVCNSAQKQQKKESFFFLACQLQARLAPKTDHSNRFSTRVTLGLELHNDQTHFQFFKGVKQTVLKKVH